MFLLPNQICFSISLENYCSCVRGSNADRDLPITALAPSLECQCQPCFFHDLSQDTKALSAGCRSTATHSLLLPCCRVGNLPQEHFIFPVYRGTYSNSCLLKLGIQMGPADACKDTAMCHSHILPAWAGRVRAG